MKLVIEPIDNTNFIPPTVAYVGDAGLDLYSLENVTIEKGKQHTFHLGFRIIGQIGMVYKIEGKSGLSLKGIDTIGNVIDRGYRGEVKATLINHGPDPVGFKVGSKIAQLLVIPIEEVDGIVLRNELKEREDNGFGSSGQ